MKTLLFCIWLLTFQAASAAEQSTTLYLPTMNCAMCPMTVKKALMKVDGTLDAKVNFNDKKATILFDDEKTNVSALIKATLEAGYPSTEAVKESGL